MSDFTTYASVVGQVLAKYRQDLNLEQAEMAEKVGISQSTWSRIERGETTLTLEQLYQIAEKLDKNPVDIMEDITTAKKKVEMEGISVEQKRSQESASKNLKKGAAIAAAVALPALAFLINRALSRAKDEEGE